MKINESLVHSKLQSLVFPDPVDLAENVNNCIQGKEVKTVKEQPIKDCCIS